MTFTGLLCIPLHHRSPVVCGVAAHPLIEIWMEALNMTLQPHHTTLIHANPL